MKTFIEPVESRLLFATFFVTNGNDSGEGSLRQAIIDLNTTPIPLDEGADIWVDFYPTGFEELPVGMEIDIPELVTIYLESELPAITVPVEFDGTIDGQQPWLALDGTNAGPNANGLTLINPSSIDGEAIWISGLIINGFGGNGIHVIGNNNYVTGNYIGSAYNAETQEGVPGVGNGGSGILIDGRNNTIEDNTITSNGGAGIAVNNGKPNDVVLNASYNNGGLPIDIGNNGRNLNDHFDADNGVNECVNYPVITSIVPLATGGMAVSGTIHTTPNDVASIMLASAPPGVVGMKYWVAQEVVQTDENGNGTWTINDPLGTAADSFVAIAEAVADPDNHENVDDAWIAVYTSELSEPKSLSPLPQVTDVFVRSSSWAQPSATTLTFMELMEQKGLGDDQYGYRVSGSSTPLILPWVKLNQIVVKYGVALAAVPTNFVIDGIRSDYLSSAALIDPQTVLLTLTRPLAGQAEHNGDRFTFYSGEYTTQFNVVQGDVDRNGGVNISDTTQVRARTGRRTNSVSYSLFHDVDGNGGINSIDQMLVRGRQGRVLPGLVGASSFTRSILVGRSLGYTFA